MDDEQAANYDSVTTTSPVYDHIGRCYSAVRQTDSRWEGRIIDTLGQADPVLNVGAGAGSYEPSDRYLLAVEPSACMRQQRSKAAAPCLAGVAEDLPFDDGAFSAAMAILTVHHWSDLERGLSELRRVADRVVVLTYDMDVQQDFWLTKEYIPEIAQAERKRVPALSRVKELLNECSVSVLPVWHDHNDGFMTAFWSRPSALLDPRVQRSCSALSLTGRAAVDNGLARLEADLDDGTWMSRHSALLEQDSFDAGFRLLVTPPITDQE